MTRSPHPPAPRTPVLRAWHVLTAYLRFKYTDKFVHFWGHLRGLPSEESRITHAALALAACVVVGTPLLVVFGSHWGTFAFQDVMDARQSLSVPGLALTFLAFGAGWGYVLAAGAQGPGWLWPLIAVEYVYLVVLVGLVDKRSYLHLLALALPVAVAALTPRTSRWAQIVVAVAVASVAAHLTPLATWHPNAWYRWYVAWPFLAAAFIGLSFALARRPWPSASHRVCLAAGGTVLYLAAIALLAGQPGQLATWVNVSLNEAFALLALLWFLMGASFIEGAIGLAQFARRSLEILAPDRWLDWATAAGWVGLAVWTVRRPPNTLSPWEAWWPAAALAALGVALVIRWRRQGVDRDWLAGWFVASAAVVLALRAYVAHDIRGLMTNHLTLLSVGMFVYGITWEIVSEIRTVPLEARGFGRPSPLLFFLGAVLLIDAASLFGLTSHLVVFQEEIVLNEYDGVVALCIPIALLSAARTWRLLPPEAIRRCQHAFGAGALVAVPAFLLRAAAPLAAVDVFIVVAVASLAAAFALHVPRPSGARTAAALGCAVALGFAVSLSQRVLVDPLVDVLNMLGALFGIQVSRVAALQIRGWSQGAADLPPPALLYYAVAAAAIVAALALDAALRGRPARAAAPTDGGSG